MISDTSAALDAAGQLGTTTMVTTTGVATNMGMTNSEEPSVVTTTNGDAKLVFGITDTWASLDSEGKKFKC